MRIIESLEEMREAAAELAAGRRSSGLVPTMGALHEGHLSLMRRSAGENGVTVVSIFVNPAQFSPEEDYDSYPRTWEEDLAAAKSAGVDIVFHPGAEQMYPPRSQTSVMVHGLTRGLCGMSRGQGHFRGVTTVVAKLFNLVRPTRAYFGQKDAQQAVVIQRMVLDLNFPVEIIVCPIVREDDGLAMSSRNRNLPPQYRPRALALRRALELGRKLIREGETDPYLLANAMGQRILMDSEIELDYLEIVSPETLEAVEKLDDLALIAGAVKIGGVRLIDNILVGPDGPWED
ncbi:MAG: pantoate--beta-alanine ligase [Planctomycetota bacterium]|jgi:pantoate--beta-alanine ligase|nr:pantoate--beta-alanine ligase [Planctomycetota bacterium]